MQETNDIPILGYGTWDVRGKDGQKSIEYALEVGYRHIDTADWYHNHDVVGNAMQASGVPRGEIYLVTKVYPPLGAEKVKRDVPRFLQELQTEYIDLLLIHWPDNTPVAETLNAMHKLQEQGLIKNIGVSNFDRELVQEALDTGVNVINNQIEIYPRHMLTDEVNFNQQNDVSVTAYSPLGQAKSLEDKAVQDLAAKYQATPAQLILAWLMDQDIIVIPKASKPDHIEQNFASRDVKLTKEDIQKLNNL